MAFEVVSRSWSAYLVHIAMWFAAAVAVAAVRHGTVPEPGTVLAAQRTAAGSDSTESVAEP